MIITAPREPSNDEYMFSEQKSLENIWHKPTVVA